MKAIRYTQYGSPDVLQLVDVEKPTPSENEVLIKVHAASANPLDWHFMRADPFFVRMSAGWQKPKNPKLGADVAGVVEAVGSQVTEFKVGDAVFGELSGLGAFAEYVCAKEKSLVLKPDNLSFEQAASVPVVGFTALQGLRDTGQIQAGQKVLVNGASGGVGTFAVQLAKYFGAEVTGVCSTRNIDLVCSIGADHAIDYTKDDFSRMGQQYDLIYDAIGNRSASDYSRALTPDGKCVIAGFTTILHFIGLLLTGALISRFSTKQIGSMGVANPNKDDLLFLKDVLEKDAVKAVIDRHYPLDETAEAIRYLETSRARGKVIVTVA